MYLNMNVSVACMLQDFKLTTKNGLPYPYLKFHLSPYAFPNNVSSNVGIVSTLIHHH